MMCDSSDRGGNSNLLDQNSSLINRQVGKLPGGQYYVQLQDPSMADLQFQIRFSRKHFKIKNLAT